MDSRNKAAAILQQLSEDKVQVALYVLELLALKEELEATEEIAKDTGLVKMIEQAKKAREEGHEEEFVAWEARHSV